MAYQPKSYRKFVATAATATLVASAVTPAFAASADKFTDVNNTYNEAVSYLLDNNITNGITDSKFGTDLKITRGDAAVLIAKALKLDLSDAPESSFGDLNNRVKDAVNALYAKGIINGKSRTEFKPADNITRAEMAKVIALAYKLEAGETKNTFTDVNNTFDPYVDALLEAGVTFGITGELFGATQDITRGQFALFMFRAGKIEDGQKNLEVNGVAATTEAGKTTVTANVANAPAGAEATVEIFANGATAPAATKTVLVNDGKVSAEFDGLPSGAHTAKVTVEDKSASANFSIEAAEAAIKEVTATGVKQLQVAFEGAVENGTDAVFEVKKGNSTIGVVSASWNEAKTAATLEINAKLTEGTYTVNVKGLGEVALTGSVEVKNEAVAEIKFLSENLVFTNASADTATVGYQLLNQYGEDVTANVALASNVDFTTSRGTDSASNGKLTISGLGALKAGDKVVVTAIDQQAAVTANATLTLVDEAKVASVTLGDLYNKNGKELSEDTADEDFYILFTAVDQYGEAVTDAAEAIDETTVLTSNTGIVAVGAPEIEELTINNKKQLAIKLNPAALKGSAVVSAIANATGAAVSKAVTVEEGVKVDTITLGTPSGTLTGNSTVKIPVAAVTNKGLEVTKLADFAGVTASASQNNVSTAAPVFTEEDGQFFLEVNTASVASGVQNLVVIVQSETNQVASKSYQVQANAKATALVGLKTDVASSIYDGETLTISESDFIVEDQYGNRIEDTSTYGVTAVSADANKINVTDATTNDSDAITLQATADSAIVTFTLTDNAGTAVSPASTFDKRFTTVQNSDFTSYKVANFGTLYATATSDTAYGKDVKVYGVTAAGTEVLLPAGQYQIVEENNVIISSGKVFGETGVVDTDANTAAPETANASYQVVINATGQTLTASGQISAVAPKAAKVEVRQGGLVDGKLLSTVESTNNTFNKADFTSPDSLYIEDQYGVVLTGVDANVRLTFSNVVNADGDSTVPTISSNGTSTAAVTNLESGDTAVVTLTVGGVSTTVNVREN
ncbi:S-layer homology domain-containing protein [Domibacillus iocasae]|uniref:SLH domain-containing protein n=1 Tax=Domibacillus iocasae TaxID=1714016 RepID=A0A1E7DPB2_9BACI|nr:S-layer homology domain-containing protein [Domibacillus iocasae]OES44930.1 hypothetical protein BA724_06615 [Domibacillus iocasae]